MSNRPDNKQDSTDILLLLGGLVVAGVGVSWLLLAKPWEMLSGEERVVPPPVTTATTQPVAAPPASASALETTLDNPLKMARLAFEAGMLVEPAGFSAWSLYEQVLEETPDQPEALDGLTLIADSLVARGAVALEQGRLNDVRDIVGRILGTLPNHDGATALAAELGEPLPNVARADPIVSSPPSPAIVEAKPALVTIVEAPQITETPPVTTPPVETPAPEPAPIDPMLELRTSFDEAMADNRLLTPADGSAAHFLDEMRALNAEADAVVQAQQQLFGEFLSRASAATAVVDAAAAETWIDAAESIHDDPPAIEQARAQLTDRLIQAESVKPFPASQLALVDYTQPRYPMRAANRNIEGWVDVEFFVTTEGMTRDVVVTDASHEEYFRQQAIEAVERWQFEPRVFLGQTIEQRAYTRIRFNFE